MSRSAAARTQKISSFAEVELLENSPEVKSYIYQQLVDFQPFVTPNTMVYVIARNPEEIPEDADEDFELPEDNYRHRIAIILKEGETQIEAEAYHDDIYFAIKLAKDNLLSRLSEIEFEVDEDPDASKKKSKKRGRSNNPAGNTTLH